MKKLISMVIVISLMCSATMAFANGIETEEETVSVCCVANVSAAKTAGDTADTVRANADATANNFFITFSSFLNLSDYFSFHI